jgi:hypothetical protein
MDILANLTYHMFSNKQSQTNNEDSPKLEDIRDSKYVIEPNFRRYTSWSSHAYKRVSTVLKSNDWTHA